MQPAHVGYRRRSDQIRCLVHRARGLPLSERAPSAAHDHTDGRHTRQHSYRVQGLFTPIKWRQSKSALRSRIELCAVGKIIQRRLIC